MNLGYVVIGLICLVYMCPKAEVILMLLLIIMITVNCVNTNDNR